MISNSTTNYQKNGEEISIPSKNVQDSHFNSENSPAIKMLITRIDLPSKVTLNHPKPENKATPMPYPWQPPLPTSATPSPNSHPHANRTNNKDLHKKAHKNITNYVIYPQEL